MRTKGHNHPSFVFRILESTTSSFDHVSIAKLVFIIHQIMAQNISALGCRTTGTTGSTEFCMANTSIDFALMSTAMFYTPLFSMGLGGTSIDFTQSLDALSTMKHTYLSIRTCGMPSTRRCSTSNLASMTNTMTTSIDLIFTRRNVTHFSMAMCSTLGFIRFNDLGTRGKAALDVNYGPSTAWLGAARHRAGHLWNGVRVLWAILGQCSGFEMIDARKFKNERQTRACIFKDIVDHLGPRDVATASVTSS